MIGLYFLMKALQPNPHPKKPLEKMTVVIDRGDKPDASFEIDWPLFWHSVNHSLASFWILVATAIACVALFISHSSGDPMSPQQRAAAVEAALCI